MVGIVVRDVSLDGGDARVEGVEDRILQPLPGQPREEPLDGVHPGRRRRGETERPVGPALRPRADPCDETVSRMTCTGVPGAIPSATGSGKARNSCERCRWRRRGPRAGRSCVRVPAWPGVTGRGFRVHRENDGMVGRVDTEADDIAGCPEGPDPVRPEAVMPCRPSPASRPVPGMRRGRRHRQCHRGSASSPEDAWRPGEARRRPGRGSGPASAGPSASTRPSAAWSRPARSPNPVPGRCGHARRASGGARDPFEACAVRVRKQDLLPIGLSPA